MKVGPRHISVTVRFDDNAKLNSMYVLKYLADRHTAGCIAAYIHKAVSSWIKLHHEKDLLDENVANFIDEAKGKVTGQPEIQSAAKQVVQKTR